MTLNKDNKTSQLTDCRLHPGDQFSPTPTTGENEEEKNKLEKLLWNIKHLQELSSRVLGFNQIRIEVKNNELIIRLPWQESQDHSSEYPTNSVPFINEAEKKFAVQKMEASKTDGEFIKELNAVMKKNYSDSDFNVEQLAKKLYISQSSLYRKIRTCFGKPPCEFICCYRLDRAAQVLKKDNAAVIDVCFEVGFNSRPYFTKCFKKKFQQLPSHFHKSL